MKSEYKQAEQDQIRTSIPIRIDDLKDLFSHVNIHGAPECDHTLKESINFLKLRALDVETVVPWLGEHGGYCDCEVIYNVYNDVGDIVGWNLD